MGVRGIGTCQFKMTDYHSMSLVELKQVAKTHKIKQYYVMKRTDLIKILTMKAIPDEFKIEKMTITQLRNIAKERGMRGYWTLHKENLIEILFPQYRKRKTASYKY